MNPGAQRAVKVVALLLAFAAIQFYVLASSEKTQTPNQTKAAPQGMGLLSTTHDNDILVDNNKQHTGATILDGARIETRDCVSASVRWGPLNRVDLGTNTIATIHYSYGKIKVNLERGCARVKVQLSVDGVIETQDGKMIPITQPEALDRKRGEVCYPANNNQDYNPHCVPPVVWIFGGGGAAAGTVAAAIALRGQNPSPGSPFLR
jgi:hypothetical protein